MRQQYMNQQRIWGEGWWVDISPFIVDFRLIQNYV